jgi:hypothetical protein
MLRRDGSTFVSWMWSILDCSVDYAYVPAGGDYPYLENGTRIDDLVVPQLPELISRGVVRYIHPVMMFAERVARAGGLVAKVEKVTWPVREYRANRGCLFMLAEVSGKSVEILEPGSLYSSLRDELV